MGERGPDRIVAHLAKHRSVVRLRAGRSNLYLDVPIDQTIQVATELADLYEEASQHATRPATF